MPDSLADHAWPASRLGEAIRALGSPDGVGARAAEGEADTPPRDIAAEGGRRLEAWIEAAAEWLDLEAVPVMIPYPEMHAFCGRSGPALMRLPGTAEPQFLVVLGGDRRRVSLLSPGLTPVRMAPGLISAALCEPLEAPWREEVERILAGMGPGRRPSGRVRQTLLREYLSATMIGGCWLIRCGGPVSPAEQAREAGLPRLLAQFLIAQVIAQGLWVFSWGLLGGMTLAGRLDPGWLGAWLLLLMTLVPFRLAATSAAGRIAIRGGALLKRRLLVGAINLEPDEVRHLGIGQLLGRVIESEALESMAVGGGLLGLTAAIELVVAGVVLAEGAGGWGHLALLLVTLAGAAGLGLRYTRRLRRWTEDRLAMTDDLVERMAGHRTRLVQEAREHWHEAEDRGLAGYLGVSQDLDRAAVALQVLIPRGWFLASIVGLAPAFLAGDSAPGSMALGIGGLVLAYRALRDLGDGLERVAAAAVAWERIAPFAQASARRVPVGHPRYAVAAATTASDAVAAPAPPTRNGHSLLDVRDLAFRYRDRDEPLLLGITVRIRPGDHMLLEGPSGGGKSTLAALLAGCRIPDAGLMLLGGLDRETLGAGGWRRRIVLAPQFHENHVFMGTFAFNTLMGRDWPPRPDDLDEAGRVCRALGLGPLLDRMPAGLNQIVGETGWQLSHGEGSRLYIARALLQRGDLLILDESFAALDPETLRRTLASVIEWSPTVLVIAHL